MMRALLIACLAAFPLQAGEVVLNADTGEIIAGADANAQRYPASVTKLMTIYVALDAAANGELSLDAKIRVSKHAAAAPPVKLGLKAGRTIRLEQAIHAALTLSSNDAARAIAEAVSGSEAAFAQRMTRTGRRIGLKATVFRNASGLPDPDHVSTTADMARLAAEVDRAFGPYLRALFRATLTWSGRRFGPRNGTVAAPAGAQLGKTGFTCAAGYTAAVLLETAEGRFAIATTANSGKRARAASLARLSRGDVTARDPAPGCGAPGRATPSRPTPKLANRTTPLTGWALTLGVFEDQAAALSALDAGRSAVGGEVSLGHRSGGPGVYALVLANDASEAVRKRAQLTEAGLRANILAPHGAAMLGIALARRVGG